MSAPATAPDVNRSLRFAPGDVSLALAAVVLTLIFWRPLWLGGGLVGSDIYAYFLPQKAYFADCLRTGTLPLWNHLVGHGYPQLAESQTGVFYPLHWAVYPWLSLNTAYSASMVMHYVLAFVFAAMYARRIGLAPPGAGMAALVFTYGWFPPRICLEWSITTGAWLPLALWCAESFVQFRLWRHAFFLTAVLAVQMLAGHFVLAFVTQLTVLLYVSLRLWFAANDLPTETGGIRRGLAVGTSAAILASFFVAAVQLVPTWELKQHSQRLAVTAEHDPGYGSIPPRYLTQIVDPWKTWYADENAIYATMTPGSPRTNRVEAHLYFGFAPLLLAVWGACCAIRSHDRKFILWLILGLTATIYATGCLLPVTRHIPGFNFFEGPGRYGVVATLAAGLLAGVGFDRIDFLLPSAARSLLATMAPKAARRGTASAENALRGLIALGAFIWTAVDLYDVSRKVTYTILVADPPAAHLAESPLREYFARLPQPSRIFSQGKNLPSLLGTATVPTYLGLGPAQYFDPSLMLPQPGPTDAPSLEQLDWFHRAGVTHYLAFEPSDENAWSARLAWAGHDGFLNQALGRPANSKFYLYELRGGRGRVAWKSGAGAGNSAAITEYAPNRVVIAADSSEPHTLILTDLAYPGWRASLDGNPVGSEVVEGMYRGVEISPGNHVLIWTYQSVSLYWGIAISLSSILILLALAHVRFWYPGALPRLFRMS